MKFEITFSEDEITAMIADKLKEEGYLINEIEYNYGTHSVGYGMSEYMESYFSGCTVEVKKL